MGTAYREYGPDVIALIGMLRYRHHHSLAELHQTLRDRGMVIGEQTVLNLLSRYEELVSLHLSDRQRLQEIFAHQTSAILALDGLRLDVGHEVLWVLRESVSGEILLARPLLSEWETDLAALISERLLLLPANVTPSRVQNSGLAISRNGEYCNTKWRVAMKLVGSNTVSERLLWSILQHWRRSCASNQCGPRKKYVSSGVCCIQQEEPPIPLYTLFAHISPILSLLTDGEQTATPERIRSQHMCQTTKPHFTKLETLFHWPAVVSRSARTSSC